MHSGSSSKVAVAVAVAVAAAGKTHTYPPPPPRHLRPPRRYLDNSKNVIGIAGSGSGGYAEMQGQFVNSAVVWGALRVQADARSRFVVFSFLGEDVGGMKKGRAGMHTNGATNFFEPSIGVIGGTDAADMTAAFVEGEVKKLANASVVSLGGGGGGD